MNTAVSADDRAAFDALTPDAAAGADMNLDVILDVSVSLSLEVGRTRIPIRNLLQLNQGSVVELERAAGEPLDVFVNGTLAFRNGAPTNAKPGRVMQRTPNMPSRATNIDLRRVSVKGEKGKSGHVVRIDLTQGAGRREASGTLTIDGVSYRPGFIQTTKSWATISAVDDQGRAALITIDMDRRSNAGTGMIVKFDGEEIWRSPGMLGVGSIQGI